MSNNKTTLKTTLKAMIDLTLEDELTICIHQYNTKKGCKFNKGIDCKQCGSIPLLLKLINGKVEHDLTVPELIKKYRL